MTFQKKYKRKHLRAPMGTYFLYEDDGYVYKAKTVNISEEGVLIESLPHLPRINIIPVFFDIPRMVSVENLSMEELRSSTRSEVERDIHRARVKTIRRSGITSDVEQIFVKNIGGQIVNVPDELRFCISNYVASFAKNTIFLLKLLENASSNSDRIEQIRLIAEIMGYGSDLKISILRQKVVHDYQSLQHL